MGHDVYPSYEAGSDSDPPRKLVRLRTSTGACDMAAAAVLDVGRPAESPSANTFLNSLCWRVLMFTSTKPAGLARGDCLIVSGGDMKGATWRKVNDFSSLPLGPWKTAVRFLPSIEIRWVLKHVLTPFSSAITLSASPYFGTGNMVGLAIIKWKLTALRTPDVRIALSQSHMTFWGAPPHLIGHWGCVKKTSPSVTFESMASVFSAPSGS
mmetsp:Transcript_35777/g.91362  ORF Transcript_35777/g.91362 Transcript_35777/m.91362 type:complete len:210 (+) Transcript_35777:293-922(+)